MSPDYLNKEASIKLIDFYRKNPAIAAYDILNVDMYDIQQVLLEEMWFRNFVVVVASRGAGKTFMQAVFAALTAMLYPGQRIGFVSASFRQAKFMFKELERLYEKSSILREAAAKPPVHGADSWNLQFKAPTNYSRSGSWIEAVPLGGGDKIRGARFHVVCIDEMASVPDDLFKMVIKPMAATTADPMVNVRRAEEEKRLVDLGVIKEGDLVRNKDNKIIMTSSGNFTFNHLYSIYKEYREQMEANNKKYFVCRVPFDLVPKAFLSENIVEDSKKLSSFEFKMEFGAGFVGDSDGLFKASLLHKKTSRVQSIELSGVANNKYIMSVDPAREETAATAIVVLKVVAGVGTVVYAEELFSTPFPDQARYIKRLYKKYNASIFMDSGGGGKALQDLLFEKENDKDISITAYDYPDSTRDGLRILHMINFYTEWIIEANFNALSLLEQDKLYFPAIPTSGKEKEEIVYELINKTMKNQIASIVVSQTKTGKLHFDVPSSRTGRAIVKNRKDLYSCFIMVSRALYEDLGLLSTNVEEQKIPPVLLGIIKPVGNRSSRRNKNEEHKVPAKFKERYDNGRFFK